MVSSLHNDAPILDTAWENTKKGPFDWQIRNFSKADLKKVCFGLFDFFSHIFLSSRVTLLPWLIAFSTPFPRAILQLISIYMRIRRGVRQLSHALLAKESENLDQQQARWFPRFSDW
jgi:hypothetical protein